MTEISKLESQKTETKVLGSVRGGDNTIFPTNRPGKFRGLCSKCYSSGVYLILDEETFETVCENCRKN